MTYQQQNYNLVHLVNQLKIALPNVKWLVLLSALDWTTSWSFERISALIFANNSTYYFRRVLVASKNPSRWCSDWIRANHITKFKWLLTGVPILRLSQFNAACGPSHAFEEVNQTNRMHETKLSQLPVPKNRLIDSKQIISAPNSLFKWPAEGAHEQPINRKMRRTNWAFDIIQWNQSIQ